ncbi:1-phosphofructokinase family hexose kinase [Pseudalkalibacillus sp. A8]|uniref:1-phosphofructokinase family hexose kinase n=1 Tax=Pseudalkalibacillus sp. A8 TaxID=3382641 RepID=UPI0038B576EB
MITTVTLNPAIDITYYIPEFQRSQIHRVDSMYKEPGGKGINVAKVIKTLKAPVMVTGMLGGNNGRTICRLLDSYSIPHDFHPISGESRLCLNIIDQHAHQTEILEKGPEVSEKELGNFKRHLEKLSKKSRFVIFSGSLPAGVPQYAYGELIELVQHHGADAIVDTSGKALEYALAAKPFMVKPNINEVQEIYSQKKLTKEDVWKIIENWHDSGISASMVSDGADGMMVRIHEHQWTISPPVVKAVNTVGCGDTLAGALAVGFYNDQTYEECLINATAAAVSNAMEKQAGKVSIEKIDQYKQGITLKKE